MALRWGLQESKGIMVMLCLGGLTGPGDGKGDMKTPLGM